MYTVVNTLPQLLVDAEEYVLVNDRELYRPYFCVLEAWCRSGGKCVIGGRVGAELLLGVGISKDSWFYELYCKNTNHIARAIADDMYACKSAHIDNRTVQTTTELRDAEQTIYVNGRRICKLYRIRDESLLGAVVVDGYFGGRVRCIGAQLQLDTICHDLYSPSKFSQWEASIRMWNALASIAAASRGGGTAITHELVGNECRDGAAADGAATAAGDGAADGDCSAQAVDADTLCEFELTYRRVGGRKQHHDAVDIVRTLAAACDIVFVGSVAMRALSLETTGRRVQAIATTDPDEITHILSRIAGGSVNRVEYDLQLVGDFRLSKHTYYRTVGDAKTAILDIFNAANHELIPYVYAEYGDTARAYKIRVGNPWVCLRFRLVDLWSIQTTASVRRRSGDGAGLPTDQAMRDIETIRDHISNILCGESLPQWQLLFPTEQYAGIYVPERISKKRQIAEAGEKFPPYYPAKKHTA